MHDAVDRGGGRVDARWRKQPVRGRQIRRWKAQLPTASGATDDRAVDEIMMAEQRTGFIDAPLGKEPPDPRAADDEVLVPHWIDLLGAEPIARPQAAKHRVIARALVSE